MTLTPTLTLLGGLAFDAPTSTLQPNDSLTIDNGIFVNPRKRFFDSVDAPPATHPPSPPPATETIDCTNLIISPGFLDIQINGGHGVDYSISPSALTCQKSKRSYAQNVNYLNSKLLNDGVTGYCPTLVTCSTDSYTEIINTFHTILSSTSNLSSILGMHLEGPYFAKAKKGAHNEAFIVNPASSPPSTAYGPQFDTHVKNKIIALITLAPELPGAPECIKSLTEKGVRISMGHTMCTNEEAGVGIASGATLATHLYNAMPGFHHRESGLVGCILGGNNDGSGAGGERPFFSIISDGIHCAPSAVKMAWNAHPGGTILVTDAMTAMGLPDGKHNLGSMEVEKTGVKAVISGTDTLAGSCVSLDYCLRKFVEFTGCSVAEGLTTVTRNPARFLGVEEERGTLGYGARGDVVLLNEGLEVMVVIVGGKIVVDNRVE